MVEGGQIEQLHYAWAARGVEGMNRFQIAAISPGLKAGAMASLLPAIRKICRYDRPKGDAERLPVSFGWFDHRGHRVAFHRVGLPRSPGKRGGFAAHVLAGPPELLGEADIASTFGSPFWWSGLTTEESEAISAGKRDFELPALGLDDLLHGRVEPDGPAPPAALVLAHGLLTLPADKRLAVLDAGEELGPALRVLSRRLPETLEGVSLSTYESGAASFPFQVIGTARATSRSQQCDLAAADSLEPEARQLLESLLGSRPEHALLREAARGSVHPGGPKAAEALWRTAGSLFALAGGAGAVDAAVARALAQPDAIAYVAREPAGRASLAEVVRAGGAAVLQALRLAWGRMGSTSRDSLCRDMAERYVEAGDLAGIAAVSGALPDRLAREAMLDKIVAAALGNEQLCRSLGGEDAVAIVSRVAGQRMPVNAVCDLLTGASRHIDRCAEVLTLPSSYLAAMFRAALRDPRNDAALATTLRRQPAILAGVELGEDERDRCLCFLERLPTAGLEGALPALLPSLADPERKPRIDGLLRRLSTGSAGRCIIAAAAMGQAQGSGVSAGLSELCDDQAALLIAHGATPLALELLTCSGSSAGPTAARLLRSTIHRSREPAVSVARRAATLEHDGLRAAIVNRALDCAVDDVRWPEEVGAIWLALAELHVSATDAQRLELLLGHGLRSPGGTCGAPLLAWVALFLLPVQPKLLGRSGHLRERRIEESAQALAADVPEHWMEEMQPYVKEADRRYTGWWKSLEAHRRKEAKRRRR